MKYLTICVGIVFALLVNSIIESSAVPISGFELAIGYDNYVYLEDGTSFVIRYVYTGGTTPIISAKLDTGVVLSATVAPSSQDGEVNAQSTTMSSASVDFESYLLTLDLRNSENNMTTEMVVLYEEEIAGFEVTTSNVYLPVNEDIEFEAIFTSGSNIELEWFLDDNDTILVEHPGVVRNVYQNYTFTTSGTYNVTVIAVNAVSRTLASILVTVQNRVNGFSISHDEGPIDTQTNVEFTVNLSSAASLPMGNVFINFTYGDGQTDEISLNGLINTLQSTGSAVQSYTHQYMTQGNYTIDVAIYNEIDQMSFTPMVYIWNQLSVYMSTTLVKAKVDEVITFDFVSPPTTGFNYYIEYGDGTVKQDTGSSILYNAYSIAAWTHIFVAPEVYTVKMSAWNPFYNSYYEITIVVQYPIPDSDISLLPAADEIPLPDGILVFTLEMIAANPQPTNVTCNYDYGEFIQSNVLTDIIYGIPIIKTYNYTTGATHNVNFTCLNEVSFSIKTSQIIVRTFTLNDFVINYDLISGMNMMDTNTDPNKHPTLVVVPVTKQFQIGLFNVSRLPPDISFTWDFGDGTPIESGLISSFTKEHNYTERGTFTIQVTMDDANTGSNRQVPLHIQLGVITITSDKIMEQVGLAPFTFTASGVVGGTYTFSVYPGGSATVNAEPATYQYTYNTWGVFFPYVTGTNGTFTETTYSEVVYSDYSFENMSSFTNETIFYPPGETKVVISIPPGAQALPNITCQFDMDDFVDPRKDVVIQNISGTNPLIYDFQYLSLGEHTAKINCSNVLKEFYNETTILVGNGCYKITGIFDRQYSTVTNPMKVSTSQIVDLSNRMPVLCPHDNPRYDWEFYKIEGGNETRYNKHLPPDVAGSVRFSGETPEGLYKVILNISLWGDVPTWLSEFTYLKFEKAPPYLSIVGGSQKTAKLGLVQIDAMTDSYDPEGGYGYNANLDYSWFCHRFNTSDLTELDALFNEEITPLGNGDGVAYLISLTNAASDCRELLNINHGIAELNATSYNYKGYIIVVQACIDSITGPKCSSFLQLIQALLGDPPEAKIDCRINCKEKFAATSKMNVRATCSDCATEELTLLSYKWEVKELNSGTYIPFTDAQLIAMSETGTTISSLVLKPNVLEPGKTYILSVTMSLPTRGAPGKAISTLKVNYPPYDGECYASPVVGNATTTPFSFICKTWKDEGIRDHPNDTLDTTANEPMSYEYASYTKKIVYGVLEEVIAPLYYGSESTATEMLLSVGDQLFDYDVTIVIKVFDYFGDYTKYNFTIKVEPDLGMIPSSKTDTAAIENMLSTFKDTYDQMDAGGNKMAAVQVIATTASLYTSSLIPISNTTTHSSEEVLALTLSADVDPSTLLFEEEESPITVRYKQVTETFTNLLLNKIPDMTVANQTYLAPADVTTVVKSLETCVSNPDYIKDNTITNVADASVMLMENLIETVNVKPFPVEAIPRINEAVGGMISMLEKTLEAMIPPNLLDLNKEISDETVSAEYDDFITYNNIDLVGKTQTEKKKLKDKIVTIMIAQKEKEKQNQQRKIALAKINVPKMLNAIATAQRALAALIEIGQPEFVVAKTNVEISVQLANFVDFLKSNPVRRNFEIEFGNNTAISVMQLWLAYFTNPIHIYGDGASKITSAELKVSAKTPDNVDIKTPLTLKVTNEGIAHFKEHEPVIQPGDPDEMLYFSYEITDKDDATIFYIKPDILNFDSAAGLETAFANADFELYITYARDDQIPRITNNDFEHQITVRDWEGAFGFKVFMSGRFEAGRAHIALRPLKDKTKTNTAGRKKRSVVGRDRHGAYINYDPLRTKQPLDSTENKDPYFNNFQVFGRHLLNTTDPLNASDPNSTTIAPEPVTISSFQPAGVNFSVIIVTTGCRTWDEATSSWTPNGCEVLELSTLNETICRCPDPPPDAVFATTFFVPPNTIDFSTVWSKFDASNAAVYGTCIALIVIYLLSVIWARREDKKDVERWATLFLCDSNETDDYFYVITVHTGLRRGAGTKSNVNFVVAGEVEDSGVRVLSDGVREGFETSSVKKFFMGTSRPLGDLTYLRIWHDSSGNGPYKSWYLHKILIDDPQTNKRYAFQCDNWLALEQGDGNVERLLPVCGRENLETFEKLFSGHARFNLTESHIWLSLVMRPEKSTFTRVQRLSCILALLFLTMIASAMFFRSSSDEVNPNQVQIGFIRISLTMVYISFVSILITTPPVLLVTLIFKKVKAALPKQPKKLDEKMRKSFNDIYKEDAKTKLKDTLKFSEDFYKDTTHPLPHWTVYIAWFIVVAAVVVSTFFLILYSMEWGKSKAEEWLFSFFFSFVESLVVVDPVKVIMIAVLLALIFRRPMDEKAEEVNLEKVRGAAKTYSNGPARHYLNLRRDILSKNEPPPASELEKMRNKRKKELEAQRIFFELIIYILYVIVLYSISYINRDQRSHYMRTNIVNHLITSTKTQFGFSKVSSTELYFKWMNETLFPQYFPIKEFNGVDDLDVRSKLFFGDLANVRVGPARLRQVRMKNENCSYPQITSPERDGACINTYNIFEEDENTYCFNWTPYNSTACPFATNPELYYTANAWKYTDSTEIWGVPITGEFNTYGGGGYILKFEKDLDNSRLIVEELKRYMWIDRGTRAVFMEFTFYNANANLFAYCIFLAEFTEVGGLISWNYIQTFRPYLATGALWTIALICYFIFMLILILTTIKIVRKIKTSGFCLFFRVFWNALDFICILLSYTAIAMWAVRFVYATRAMVLYYNDKDAFINFQHIVIWDYVFNITVAILVFVGTIRILRLLGYNKRMTQLADVLKFGGAAIIAFVFILVIGLFAFVSLGYLLFGSTLYDYRNVFASFGSLSNTLIGRIGLDSMVTAAGVFAQLYFFTYVLCILLILMTVFAAILNQSIAKVKQDVTKIKHTYGIVDVVKGTLRDAFGVAFTFDSKKKGKDNDKEKNRYQPKSDNPDIDATNLWRLIGETFTEVIGRRNKERNRVIHVKPKGSP